MKPRFLAPGVALAVALHTAAAEPPRAASFAEFDRRAKAGETLSVVFFGGSLTWSANASDPNVTGFRPLVAEHLRAKYPAAHFRFHDAAIGGTGSMLGIFRLDRDVFAHGPDLVFLDFACNDGGGPEALAQSCCYESILRRLVGQGVPVVQMFFTFRFWAVDPTNAATGHPQLAAYRRLAEEYATGVGDVYRDGPLFPDLRAGKATLDDVWPFDAAHPGDLGYRYFAAAGIAGLDRAVERGLVCRVPDAPVFGDVADVARRDLGSRPADGSRAESPEFVLPDPWTPKATFRTSLWFDGLSSRWMDSVAVFSGTNRAPLQVRARMNLVGLFGESDENGLACVVRGENGERLAEFLGNRAPQPGRLFFWRQALLPGWERGETGVRTIALDPVPDGVGELRIGSICTASLLPADAKRAPAPGDALDIDAIDHGRQP